MLKQVLARIWALYGLIVFVATLMIFVWPIAISFLIPEPTGMKVFKSTSAFWMRCFLFLIGCPLKVIGKEHYDGSKNYVVTANHQSFMDVPLLTPFFPGLNKTIAKKSMSRIPFFGWVYIRGSVLVDRSSDSSRKKSFEAMKNVLLKEKINMAVYPEGTRNRTGTPLKEFYDGAFRLAVDCKKDIIPVVIFNTAYALPPSRFFFLWPIQLQMHLLPAISSTDKTHKQLKAETYEAMWKYMEQHNYAPPKG